MGYNIINLKDIYKAYGEEKTKKIISDFECNLNKDVEYFLKEKAIEFSRQSISETFIVTSSYKRKEVIVGYFALANKVIRIKKNMFRWKKKETI